LDRWVIIVDPYRQHSKHCWGDLFVSDIPVRRSVVTSAFDWHFEI